MREKRIFHNLITRHTAWIPVLLVLMLVPGCNIGEDVSTITDNTEQTETVTSGPQVDWKVSDGYIRASEASEVSYEVLNNAEFALSVPTYIDRIDGDWFIVDCYHDQVIYNSNLGAPLNEWKVLTKEAHQPHTMAGDNQVLVVDDTENNMVRIFECVEGEYRETQHFSDIGNRPHYTVYDEEDKAFYVWSSTTGEMYVFRHEDGDAQMYLTEIRKVGGTEDSLLNGTYIRSFYIDGDDIYFVSGITAAGTASGIIICDKYSFEVKQTIAVPDKFAGMASMRYDAPYYYITVSTDVSGRQDAATFIRTKSLEGLETGDYEDIYSEYFVGGGTPYNMFEVDGTIFLTEHRLPAHAIWSYKIDIEGNITDVNTVY